MTHKATETSLCRLAGIRSTRLGLTTAAGNHIESPQSIPARNSLSIGRSSENVCPATGFFENHWRVERFEYSSHQQKLFEVSYPMVENLRDKRRRVNLRQFVADDHGQGWPGGGFRELAWFISRKSGGAAGAMRARDATPIAMLDAQRRTLAHLRIMIYLQFGAGLSHS
jgi:hypothetical protein